MTASTAAPESPQRPGYHRTGSMIPEPNEFIDTEGPAECVGTFMSMTWDEKTHKTPPDHIMKDVRYFCESQAMIDFCERAGLHGVKFEWNPGNDGGNRFFNRLSKFSTRFWNIYERNVKRALHIHSQYKQQIRFWDAYERDKSVKNMGVVFHGSPEERIPKILKDGLDQRYRRTQAFGKGEYFSKDPGLATTYCQGGHKLVVYLVFIPEEHERTYNQKDRDIIVVNNVSHELPIGVLSFESVDRKVVQHTQELRIEQKALKNEAMEKEAALKKAQENGEDESVIKALDQEVHDAWEEYFRTKFDHNRNLMEHLHVSPVTLHH